MSSVDITSENTYSLSSVTSQYKLALHAALDNRARGDMRNGFQCFEIAYVNNLQHRDYLPAHDRLD